MQRVLLVLFVGLSLSWFPDFWCGDAKALTKNNSGPEGTPIATPTATPTPRVTATPTQSPTPFPSPTVAPTVSPTSTPTIAPTVSPTLQPTVQPTTEPTQSPTGTPTVVPTSPPPPPTPTPTQTPLPTPNPDPTKQPTPTPGTTLTPTPTPTQTPTPTASPLPTGDPQPSPSPDGGDNTEDPKQKDDPGNPGDPDPNPNDDDDEDDVGDDNSDDGSDDRTEDPPPLPPSARGGHIVTIMFDDLDGMTFSPEQLFKNFPNMASLMRGGGTYFKNLVTSSPLCGPARAAFFSGMYAHNTGIFKNFPEAPTISDDPSITGGFGRYFELGLPEDDLPVWMQEAGYYTAMVGKYLHHDFPQASGIKNYVPPGWDDFVGFLGGKYRDTTTYINGEWGTIDEDEFRTYAEGRELQNAISKYLKYSADRRNGAPLFLNYNAFAPHKSAVKGEKMYPEELKFRFSGNVLPRNPDFNWGPQTPSMDSATPLTKEQIIFLEEEYRERLRGIFAVDQVIGDLIETLDKNDMLEDTTFVFLSDNGFMLGAHRRFSKKLPYVNSTTTSAYVIRPDDNRLARQEHLISTVDLFPSLLELAGYTPPEELTQRLDGKSFVPLLKQAEDEEATLPSPEAFRSAALSEHAEDVTDFGNTVHALFRKVLTYSRAGELVNYIGWHWPETFEREFYNLILDPWELFNEFESLTARERKEYESTLNEMARCSGPGCIDDVGFIVRMAPGGRGEGPIGPYGECWLYTSNNNPRRNRRRRIQNGPYQFVVQGGKARQYQLVMREAINPPNPFGPFQFGPPKVLLRRMTRRLRFTVGRGGLFGKVGGVYDVFLRSRRTGKLITGLKPVTPEADSYCRVDRGRRR